MRGSSNLFSIGKYSFFIYEIKHNNFALKKRKSLDFSRDFGAISFLSPFDVKGGEKRYFTFLGMDLNSCIK